MTEVVPDVDAGRPLRVLVVTSQFPYPPTWGAGMRVYQLARHLALRHDVTLLSYADHSRDVQTEDRVAVCRKVVLVPREPVTGRRRRAQQARAVVTRSPFSARTLFSAPLQTALTASLQAGYDIVQVEGSPLMCLDYGSATVVLDEHNIESEVLQRMRLAERSRLRRAYNGAEAAAYRQVERRAWARAAACVVTSEREIDAVTAVAPATPVLVVPNAVDPALFAPSSCPVPTVPDRIVFTGLLRYRPNLDAVHWFVEDVLPRVRRQRPGATFVIVGDGDPDDLADLRGRGVEVTGLVPDIRPYLASAACVVAPLRMGGGTRLKVLEALSMQKPLVSTTLGCEGLDVRDAEHLLIADGPDDMARAVTTLLEDRGFGERLGATGRQLVLGRYSWARSAEALHDVHAAVAGAGQ